MKNSKAYGVLMLPLMMSACQSTALQPPQPARLHSTNAPACYQQIEQLISAEVKAPVSLGTQVFEQDAKLYLDNKVLSDTHGMRKDGLLLGKPLLFELRTQHNQCLLIRTGKGWQAPVPACICQTI